MSPLPGMPELIIDRPELQPRTQRTVFGALTALAWTAYIYLWLPLVTLGAWWVGFWTGIQEMSIGPRPFVDLDLFVLLLKAAVLAILLMVGWAEYNRLRFQGNERRGPRPTVLPDQTAQAFGASPELARRLRGAQIVTLVLDEHARPVDLQVHRVLDDGPTLRIDAASKSSLATASSA